MSTKIRTIMERCTLCPRECGANRVTGRGFCGESETVRIARAELHMWEEPPISGKNGAGTVFFCGCTLRCCYCQNHEISHGGKGFALTVEELSETFLRMQELGAHNVELVTPTHFTPQIIEALDMAGERLNVPVVWNSGGYDKPETLRMLGGRVKIFLPDLKYASADIAQKYSQAGDYPDAAFASLREMCRIAGKPVIEDGVMKSGVIVRHMILPNHRRDSIELIRRLREEFSPDDLLVSLMCQYTPMYMAGEFREINRRLSRFEYETVAEELERSGFDGFFQERTSAKEEYVPEFFSEKYF